MIPKYITAKWLTQQGACAEQVRKFRRTYPVSKYPKGVRITKARLIAAAAAGFDISWLSWRLTAPVRAEYDRVVAQAWAEYDRVTAQARAEYYRVTAQAWAEYDRVVAQAWAEYDRVVAQARAEYDRVVAQALWAELQIEWGAK